MSLWEKMFAERKLMWGEEPTRSALLARDRFVQAGARKILVPGAGYGRNAKVFVDAGMEVTGIEISETAIGLARSGLGLDMRMHHGSVTDMPFDDDRYDGIFCYGLLYLLDEAGRTKHIADCHRQLAPGGQMMFTVIAKQAPMYRQGTKLGEDWYEVHPGVPMYFYDEDTIGRDFGAFGLVSQTPIVEPVAKDVSFPFLDVLCRKAA